jgi:hypothetical protein
LPGSSEPISPSRPSVAAASIVIASMSFLAGNSEVSSKCTRWSWAAIRAWESKSNERSGAAPSVEIATVRPASRASIAGKRAVA